MNVEKVGEDKYLQALRLSEYAFQYKVPEDQIKDRLQKMKKHHQLFGIVEEEELVAKLHFLPLKINLGEKTLKMGGIAGVATYPEHRRKGYVKKMLIHILEKMKQEGYSVSMLYPFSVPFYREYGWELFSDKLTASLTKSDLQFQAEVPGKIKRFPSNLSINDLAHVYDQYAKRFSGMLVRDQDWWENIVKNQEVAIYYSTSNASTGYLIYEVKNKKMKVEEFVALNGEARRGLWNYICQHDSMINEIEMITSEKEPLLFSMKEPRFKREITPYFMARIVDVVPFLKEYSFEWRANSEVTLKITDSYAPWNNQIFNISAKSVVIVTEEQVEEKKVIALSINALTTILFGYKRPNELMQIEEITGDSWEIQKLEELIPRREPYFYDFF
jgi:predicted acetyltransferase